MTDALSDGMPTPRDYAIQEAKWKRDKIGLRIARLWSDTPFECLAVTIWDSPWGGSVVPSDEVSVILPKDVRYPYFKGIYDQIK